LKIENCNNEKRKQVNRQKKSILNFHFTIFNLQGSEAR